MRNVKNVTGLLTRKQKENAITEKVVGKKYKNVTVGYESTLFLLAWVPEHNNNTVYGYLLRQFS